MMEIKPTDKELENLSGGVRQKLDDLLKGSKYVYIDFRSIKWQWQVPVSVFSRTTSYPGVVGVPEVLAEKLGIKILTEEEVQKRLTPR